MERNTVHRLRFMAEHSMKNLIRYRKRYMMFGVILFLLTAVFSAAMAVSALEETAEKAADLAMRLTGVSGVLLVILLDTVTRLTISVRKNEMSAAYRLGISMTDYLTALGFELLLFDGMIWLTGTAVGSVIAGSIDWIRLLAGLAAAGLVTGLRLSGIYIRSILKGAAAFTKEEDR